MQVIRFKECDKKLRKDSLLHTIENTWSYQLAFDKICDYMHVIIENNTVISVIGFDQLSNSSFEIFCYINYKLFNDKVRRSLFKILSSFNKCGNIWARIDLKKPFGQRAIYLGSMWGFKTVLIDDGIAYLRRKYKHYG